MDEKGGAPVTELDGLSGRFAERLGGPATRAIAGLIREHAPDERLALAFLLKLAEQSPSLFSEALADAALLRDLVFCLGSSEVVATALGAMGDEWLDFFRSARAETGGHLLGAISFDTGVAGADRGAVAAALGALKRRFFVRIAVADLLRRVEVADTMRAMSRLADECVGAALVAARRLVGERAGAVGDFCVIGMGKLGAGELNLSSDIDLVYVYDPPGGAGAGVEGAARLGETLTELVSADCFRVDLRLRPGGRSSPLVASVESALNFYLNFGQTWERAALLRARPVAGAFSLGARLLHELRPFIYRGYLDFETLKELRAMKRRIEEELPAGGMLRRNIKLGHGGIRELEFIVHALTLVYGGRDPRLRTENTLLALERLASLGYLEPGRARELADAYLFLRDVEHKLQVVAALQTHTLPADERGLQALAARLGFGKGAGAVARLRAELDRLRELVAGRFREMLGEDRQTALPHLPSAALRAWEGGGEPSVSAPLLAELGFANAVESAGHLRVLVGAPAITTRRRELLESLGPVLLDEIRALPDPDLALMNLTDFISAVGARTSFLALLEQHPPTRRVLLRLFASSRYLSALFVRHPEMLDTLVRSDLAHPLRSKVELSRELSELLQACPDFESRLNAIRTFRHQEFLRVAIADLAGDLDFEEVERELSGLAETVLGLALEVARAETAKRSPIPPELALSAVAMGRLGAGEMSYNSDLDLIFIYDIGAEGEMAAREPAARIVQKLIATLETPTRESYAYRMDLRLRPSGNAGPLVASLRGFLDYHRQSSALWERQALVRARVVAGDAALGERVEQARNEFVFGRSLTRAEVDEIARMRERIERELGADPRGRLNIKQGRGGLLDVEFLTQMMALGHGHAHPELRRRRTIELISALSRCGLLPEAEAARLMADYRFLSRLENRLRIEDEQPASAMPTEPVALRPLARRMGHAGADAAERLLAEVVACRNRIREVFVRRFAIEREAAA